MIRLKLNEPTKIRVGDEVYTFTAFSGGLVRVEPSNFKALRVTNVLYKEDGEFVESEVKTRRIVLSQED